MVNKAMYTPILKWKAAEMGALYDLTNMQKDGIIPLFEFVFPNISKEEVRKGISAEKKLMEKSISSIPNDIWVNWGDGRLFFADFTLIFPEVLRKSFSEEFCKNSTLLHLEFIPVINISADRKEYQNHIANLSIKHSLSKICIRINNADIEGTEKVNSSLEQFLHEYKFDRTNVSLLFDLKENTNIDAYATAFKSIKNIISVYDFDNLILAGGAFPKDMSPFKQDTEDNYQIREDWIGWLSHSEESLEKNPIFADYAIRHPVYDEKVVKFQSSATIKYTLPDRWKFYKGKRSKYEDYLAYAALLRIQPEFTQFGAKFSAGDKFIDERGHYFAEYILLKNKNPNKKIGGTGNTEQWLRAGINHHIAVVVDQLANPHD